MTEWVTTRLFAYIVFRRIKELSVLWICATSRTTVEEDDWLVVNNLDLNSIYTIGTYYTWIAFLVSAHLITESDYYHVQSVDQETFNILKFMFV